MTSSELETMARTVARETVKETLLQLGVNTSDGEAVTEAQQDFAFVRRARRTVEKMRTHALTVAVGLAVTGIGSAIVLALRTGSAVAGK